MVALVMSIAEVGWPLDEIPGSEVVLDIAAIVLLVVLATSELDVVLDVVLVVETPPAEVFVEVVLPKLLVTGVCNKGARALKLEGETPNEPNVEPDDDPDFVISPTGPMTFEAVVTFVLVMESVLDESDFRGVLGKVVIGVGGVVVPLVVLLVPGASESNDVEERELLAGVVLSNDD